MKNKFSVKNIILLQAVVVIYTINSIIAKKATATEPMSFAFFAFFALEACVLGIYAICWQQMIKRFDLAVAYANRAMAILWTALWAVVFFHENISLKQIIGIGLVVAGTVIVNTESNNKSDGEISSETADLNSKEEGEETDV